jgi:hypothetical protein
MTRTFPRASLVLLLSLVFATAAGAANLRDKLVLYLPMDEGKGDAIADMSDSKFKGAAHNAKWVDGKIGKALEFGGQDIWATVPDAPELNFKQGESFTLACWTMMTGAWSGQGNIVAKYKIGGGTGPFYGMFVFTGDKIHTYTRGGPNVELWSKASINDKKWHHLALVRDAGKTVTLYVDGQKDDAKDDTSGDLTNVETFSMGRHTTDQFYAGVVDEVALWRRALSQAEVQSVLQGGFLAVEPHGRAATTWAALKR